MTSNALVPIEVRPQAALLPTEEEARIMTLLARSVIGARGHAVPKEIDSAEKAFAIMLAGHELGVKPMTALRHLMVVNGKTEPDAQLMAGIVAAREPDSRLEVIALTEDACTMRLTRPQRGVKAEYTYSLADARKANLLAKGGPWVLYPKDMLRNAATKRLLRAYAPDLINSIAGVQLGAISLIAPDDEPTQYVDVDSLPEGALYSAGDEAEPAFVVDQETGEILEDAPAITEPVTAEGAAGERALGGDTEAAAEGSTAESEPPARDPRLGRFSSLGDFLQQCYDDFGWNGTQICRELAFKGNEPIQHALDYEGETGSGLDGAYIALSHKSMEAKA